jgi:hypothetical protein
VTDEPTTISASKPLIWIDGIYIEDAMAPAVAGVRLALAAISTARSHMRPMVCRWSGRCPVEERV